MDTTQEKQLLHELIDQLPELALPKALILLRRLARPSDAPVRIRRTMAESVFWHAIAQLDWSKAGDDQAVIQPLIDHLSTLLAVQIPPFNAALRLKLYSLSGERFTRCAFPGQEDFPADVFLHIRCWVVAQGQKYYHQILRNPSAIRSDLRFEALSKVADEAYYQKTGQRLSETDAFVAGLSYEDY
jgi:Protein of unknown function (DUF4240)